MVVLRCTSKLLKRMKLDKEPLTDPGASTTALGDWYANVVYLERQPLVLAVSEKSLLPLLMPARDLDELPANLMRALAEKLRRMRLPEAVIRQEISRMDPFFYGRTASRSVLGSMNDFTDFVKVSPRIEADGDLVDIMEHLGRTPCKPINFEYPIERAAKLLFAGSRRSMN